MHKQHQIHAVSTMPKPASVATRTPASCHVSWRNVTHITIDPRSQHTIKDHNTRVILKTHTRHCTPDQRQSQATQHTTGGPMTSLPWGLFQHSTAHPQIPAQGTWPWAHDSPTAHRPPINMQTTRNAPTQATNRCRSGRSAKWTDGPTLLYWNTLTRTTS